MKFRTKRRLALLFSLLFLLTSAFAASLADGAHDLRYIGVEPYGYTYGDLGTGLLLLEDGSGARLATYCIDTETVVQDGSMYRRTNLSDTELVPQETAGGVRAVILNAYPYFALEALQGASGIPALTAQEAISAAQLAIWHYTDGRAFTPPEANVLALYNWYLSLPAAQAAQKPVASLSLEADYSSEGDTVLAVYRFMADETNADGTPIALRYGFTTDVAAAYGAIVTDGGTDQSGKRVVMVSGLPADASFRFFVEGTQTVAQDCYFYAPQGGRDASQSLIGAYEGQTRVYRDTAFAPEVSCGFTLSICKQDSLTLAGLEGAVFEIADTEAFDGTVYTVTTDENGFAAQTGLTAGTWYVREKEAPIGYIPYEGVFPVEVHQYTHTQYLKNTAYSFIRIVKTDDKDGNVAGATFDIYEGDDATDESKRVYTGLETDANGVILQGNLTPGTYTVVETAVPEGWVLDPTPQTLDVKPGETTEITLVNHYIERCVLQLYKRDAKTTEQLAGAVLGVYADAAFTQKLYEVITARTGPIEITDLMPGVYHIKELAVPEGYLLDSVPQSVELVEGENRAVTFYNNEVPHTAGNYGMLLLAGGVAFLLTAGLAIAFRKRIFGKAK